MRPALAAAAPLLALLLSTVAGCRPESVTGARDQLSRGEGRVVSYRVPVAREAYGALDFLEDVEVVVLDDGLVGVAVLPDTLRTAVGPELPATGSTRVEAVEEFDGRRLDFGELESAVKASTLRRVPVTLSLRTTASVPLVLEDGRLGAVRLDESGDPAREPDGDLDLETDGDGDPILVPVAGPAADSVVIPAGDTLEATREAAPLVDRLVDLSLSDQRVATVLLGTLKASGTDRAQVQATDSLVAVYRPVVGLELTLPDSGAVVRRTVVGEGVGLSAREAEQVEDRVVRAGAVLAVRNGLPFAVRVDVAYLEGRRPGAEPFEHPDRTQIDSLFVPAGRRDADGSGPEADTVEVSLTGPEVRPLLEDVFTAAVRIRLLPGGDEGRGAFRVEELVDVHAGAFIDVRSGSEP